MSSDGNKLQMSWFPSWCGQISNAKNREEQTVIQSLFFHGLRVSYQLTQSPNKSTDPTVYLLLDLEDGNPERDSLPLAAVQALSKNSEYVAWKAVTNWLHKLIGGDGRFQSAAARFGSLCDQQTAYFYEVTKDPDLVRYANLVIIFDRRRSKAALLDAEDTGDGDSDSGAGAFRDALYHGETSSMPGLTRWQ